MFDQNLFDRNAFDRSVSSDTALTAQIFATGQFNVGFVVATPLVFTPWSGAGSMSPGLRMQQNVGRAFSGSGDIPTFEVRLRNVMTATLSSAGSMVTNAVVPSLLSGALTGVGAAGVDSRVLFQTNLTIDMSGTSTLAGSVTIPTPLAAATLSGAGSMSYTPRLSIQLTPALTGVGDVILRRISGANENTIELIGINLLPGQTITIDTDVLQVLLGTVEDVSSVTSDSVFFELNPGTNDLTISTDTGQNISVTAIWQNRWL